MFKNNNTYEKSRKLQIIFHKLHFKHINAFKKCENILIFFSIEKKNFYILNHFFKIIIWIKYIILNNEIIKMIIFNEKNKIIQIIFQFYILKLSKNKQEYKIIKFLN